MFQEYQQKKTMKYSTIFDHTILNSYVTLLLIIWKLKYSSIFNIISILRLDIMIQLVFTFILEKFASIMIIDILNMTIIFFDLLLRRLYVEVRCRGNLGFKCNLGIYHDIMN